MFCKGGGTKFADELDTQLFGELPLEQTNMEPKGLFTIYLST